MVENEKENLSENIEPEKVVSDQLSNEQVLENSTPKDYTVTESVVETVGDAGDFVAPISTDDDDDIVKETSEEISNNITATQDENPDEKKAEAKPSKKTSSGGTKSKTTTARKRTTKHKASKHGEQVALVAEIDKLPSKDYSKTVSKQLFMTHVLGIKPEPTQADKRQKLLKNIFVGLFLVMIIAVVIFTFYNDFLSPSEDREVASLKDFFVNLKENGFHIFIALFCLICCFLFKGLKLSIMCKSMTGKWKFGTCLQTGIIGHYYNNITPLGAGGQPFEIYHLSKNGVHGGAASSLPIAAFFMYQLAFVTLGIFSVICFIPQVNLFNLTDVVIKSTTAEVIRPLAVIGLILGMLMPALVVAFCLIPKLCAKLVAFVINLGAKLKIIKEPKKIVHKTLRTVIHNSKCLKKMASNPFVFIACYLVSVIEVVSVCSIAYFVLKFFGYAIGDAGHFIEWVQVIQICIILYAAVSFIPTPGNSGAADFSFYWLFQTGLVAGFSFPAMLLWRFLSYYAFIVIGIIFLTLYKKTEYKRIEKNL